MCTYSNMLNADMPSLLPKRRLLWHVRIQVAELEDVNQTALTYSLPDQIRELPSRRRQGCWLLCHVGVSCFAPLAKYHPKHTIVMDGHIRRCIRTRRALFYASLHRKIQSVLTAYNYQRSILMVLIGSYLSITICGLLRRSAPAQTVGTA